MSRFRKPAALAGVVPFVGIAIGAAFSERISSVGTLTRKDLLAIRQVVYRDGIGLSKEKLLPDISWGSITRFPTVARIKLTTRIRDIKEESDGSVTVQIARTVFPRTTFRLQKKGKEWVLVWPETGVIVL